MLSGGLVNGCNRCFFGKYNLPVWELDTIPSKEFHTAFVPIKTRDCEASKKKMQVRHGDLSCPADGLTY
jgi:hypothetical protein